MNQADFITTIRGFTKFTDPDVQTDVLLISYLRMAEEKLSADLRVNDMIQIDTATLTSQRTRLPSDYREMDFLRILGGKPIHYKTRDKFFEDEANMTTRDYTTSGNFLIVGGTITADAPLSVELHYFGDVEQLTSSTESWMARRYPRLLTFATMEVASLAMVEDNRAENWSDKANSLINQMNTDYRMSIGAGSKLSANHRKLG